MSRPRVVITGIAGVTPLANDIETTWQRLLDGESGICPITLFDASDYASKVAGEVKNFNPEEYMTTKQARHMDRFTQFAIAAQSMLLRDANFAITEENAYDVSVILGIGLGGLHTIEEYHTKLLKGGPSKISPFMIPMLISNMGTGQIAMFCKARGTNFVTTSACASGIHALGNAFGDILLGRSKAVISGGAEATITPLGVAGFTALKALSSHYNDTPAEASRPFEKNRDGFVIGEGAGLLLLEELEHAKARGAKIYAEVAGYGASCDAHHMTAPLDTGVGMARAMQNAIKEAGITPDRIEHINAHATSTMLNDSTETKAMKLVFGDHAKKLKISATKSMTGHLLGAAGGIETVFTALALNREMLPGTINLKEPSEDCDLDYLGDGSKHIACEYAMCNSFGFGGTNASIILKRFD
ncbi:MAG: beta-ketoacyl-ACP synthase II [Desulfovibrio sp.]|nr:beta-ketoacyl-ACP synthase II [Desulfovibrio sp.]